MVLQGTFGFLGYGNMASAILEGLIEQGVLGGRHAAIYDPAPARCEAGKRLGVTVTASAAELAGLSDVLVLAVKPQMMETALQEAAPGLRPNTLVISIAAGISITYVQRHFGAATRVVRVMPNTPALVQSGAAGIALSPNATQEDAAVAQTIFEAVGIAEMVAEKDIDAVTALSGSGPAYFFYMVECLVKAGAAEGLDEGVATRLAAQTLLGAGRLLQSSAESASILREKVTSKGGTTEAALKQFHADKFAAVIEAGVKAAAARSRELGA